MGFLVALGFMVFIAYIYTITLKFIGNRKGKDEKVRTNIDVSSVDGMRSGADRGGQSGDKKDVGQGPK